MEAGKGQARLIEALARIADVPWTAWIVGGPQEEAERAYAARLVERVAELGLDRRIRFLGQRDDVPALLAAADVYCQPNSAPEPFGVSVVEALWAGCPVVASAMGGPLEIVDASCGVLVPPGDDAALDAALRRLLSDHAHRSRLRAGAPDRAAALCAPARQRRLLLDWVGTVVAEPTARVGAP
jgi:glycosyltransferase involved in cell wall biosynthesis